MAWLRSRPKGESRLRSVSKYWPILAMPTCSNMPTDEMTSNRSPHEIPVVLHPDLHPVPHSGLVDPPTSQLRLFPTQGDSHHIGIEMGGGVDGHGAPPATDVEQPCASVLVQVELAADQLVLCRLCGLEIGVVLDKARARIRHRRPEDQPVEVVADVIVMADRRRVPGRGVTPSRWPGLFGGVGQRAPQRTQPASGIDRRGQCGQHGQRSRPDPALARTGSVQGLQRGEQVAAELDLPGHIGAPKPQIARCPHHPAEGVDGPDVHRAHTVVRANGAARPQNSNRTGTGSRSSDRISGVSVSATVAPAVPGLVLAGPDTGPPGVRADDPSMMGLFRRERPRSSPPHQRRTPVQPCRAGMVPCCSH